MDDEEFNDFETAEPVQQPQPAPTQPDPLSLSNQSVELRLSSQNFPQDISLQPSFSQITNNGSNISIQTESTAWDGTMWPPLNKMESDQVGNAEHLQLDFSKRNSQGEIANQPIDFMMGNFIEEKVKDDKKEDNQMGLNNSQKLVEFTFPQTKNTDLMMNFNADMSFPQQVQDNKPKTVDLDFEVLQNQYGIYNQPQIIQINSVIAPKNIQMEGQVTNIEQQGKKKQQLSVKQIEQQFQQYSKTEPQVRKQSEEFVFQSESQPEITTSTREEQTFIATELISTPVSEPFPFQNSQHSYQNKEQYKMPEQPIIIEDSPPVMQIPMEQVKVQEVKVEQKVQQEDDQFGQFEQTTQNIEINQVDNPPQPQPKYQMIKNSAQPVKINESKVPFGININSRQQQLQQFVDSLPDYSFLLAKAFTSV